MTIKYANNNSLSAITSKPSGLSGSAMTLLATETASSSATISFTSNIDDTYDEYVFKYINCHPETDGDIFEVDFRDGGSSYDATKTTTSFITRHTEGAGQGNVAYLGGGDLAQSTSGQPLTDNCGADADQCISGELRLFSPSSTTFVKHFLARTSIARHTDEYNDNFVAGYCNVTAAIDGVQFKFQGGDIDSGVIKLYGIS